MSHPSIPADLKPVWTPDDYQRTVADALAAEQKEFDADMAYLRGMANALFEFATPAHMAKIIDTAGIS